jgi:hypothetical protein
VLDNTAVLPPGSTQPADEEDEEIEDI